MHKSLGLSQVTFGTLLLHRSVTINFNAKESYLGLQQYLIWELTLPAPPCHEFKNNLPVLKHHNTYIIHSLDLPCPIMHAPPLPKITTSLCILYVLLHRYYPKLLPAVATDSIVLDPSAGGAGWTW